MIEIDSKEGISLKNATENELIEAFKKLDWYFDYGPKFNRTDYLERIGNIMLEIRARKIMGEKITAKDMSKEIVELQNLEYSRHS
ncbi:hypothetical protein IID10_07925 [candidate division KSB1 bacterium]|nr:hypothetical protein [candidate division KSB1 bacterium]TDI87977.1 MAG: hypothetical protein E2O77_12305 [Caldithrix sp.]TDI94391.1 MAG: hypothetical protein E2O76_15635 [Caldithrix sp.]